MTEDELERFNGSESSLPILLALNGTVFDVTSGGFYAPGNSYAVFAGRACTRAVALPSIQLEDISDDITDFSPAQLGQVDYWASFFRDKYRVVATLQPDTSAERAARLQRHLRRKADEEALSTELVVGKASMDDAPVFSLGDLEAFDGNDSAKQILLALGGHVLDVSTSAYLYGPGAPRHCYAGHSITRALAKGSTEASDIQRGDDILDLTPLELKVLQKRLIFFLQKFPKVGVLDGAPLLSPRHFGGFD